MTRRMSTPRLHARVAPLVVLGLALGLPCARGAHAAPPPDAPAEPPSVVTPPTPPVEPEPPAPPADAAPPAPPAEAAPPGALPAPPPPPPPPPTTNEADAAAVAALVGELSGGSGDAGTEVSLDEPTFSLYGFADFSYFTQIGRTSALTNAHPTFMIGNFNVYFATEFERHWRSLAEVRFLYAPNGSWLSDNAFGASTNAERGDTNVLDGSDLNHPIRWGGVSIQRIWLEYNFNSYLTLRAGQWLTPYGIWNVDHGSPTIIGVYKPYIINQDWFPERQTGIEAYGSVYLGDTRLGYHLTLSNGRGPIDAYKDLDDNKAIGARLYLKNDTLLGTLTLGGSIYRGNYTDRPGNGTAIVDGALVVNDPPTLRYEELALAADLKWEWEGLLVQGEIVYRDIRYDDAVRPRTLALPGSPPGFEPDARMGGMYALIGYRTPWLNIMPFVLVQYGDLVTDTHEYSFGLNMRPSPRVALKAEYKYIIIEDPPGLDLGDLDFLGLQLAWSF